MTDYPLLDLLAECSLEQSLLFLEQATDQEPWESVLSTDLPCARDARTWIEAFGDQDPAGWIGQLVTRYLGESSHQLAATGRLLRSRAVHATLDPLIRAVLERSGRVCWVLDPAVSAYQRAARAQLEVGVCARHYADAMQLVGASESARSELRTWRGEHRGRLHDRFEVETNGTKKDISEWSLNGEVYPSYSNVVSFALDDHPGSIGVYAGLAGCSHPNLFFARERRGPTPDTAHLMVERVEDLERHSRFALVSHAAALKRWAAYYLTPTESDVVVASVDRIHDVLGRASLVVDQAGD